MPEPDCVLRYRISAATHNFTSGKSHWWRAARSAVVLKWFYSLNRRKTFVGGRCALPSDFKLVLLLFYLLSLINNTVAFTVSMFLR